MLLAYFSRPGENYYYGDRIDLEVGNTQVLAGMIAARIDCDVHRIRPAKPYPHDYEQTVEQNKREQDDDARPTTANPLSSIDGYNVVLLASPIWNVRTPMIMSTFTEALDFTGVTVHPVTTYAMSGLGNAPDDYAATCRGARIGKGLAGAGREGPRRRSPGRRLVAAGPPAAVTRPPPRGRPRKTGPDRPSLTAVSVPSVAV